MKRRESRVEGVREERKREQRFVRPRTISEWRIDDKADDGLGSLTVDRSVLGKPGRIGESWKRNWGN